MVCVLLFTDTLLKTNTMEYDFAELQQMNIGDLSTVLTTRKFVGVDVA